MPVSFHKYRIVNLYIRPVIFYGRKWRVIRNVVVNHSDRIMTFFGVFIAVPGLIIFDANTSKIGLSVFYAVTLLLTPYVVLFTIISDPKSFSIVLTRNQDFSTLLRFSACESIRLIEYLKHDDRRSILELLGHVDSLVRTIEELHEIIACRSKISQKDIAYYLFGFNPGVFVNRKTKIAFNELYKTDDPTRAVNSDNIDQYYDDAKIMLERFSTTGIGLNWLEFIYRVRSLSVAIEYYTRFVERSINEDFDPSFLVMLQRPYSSGVIIDRLVGICLISILRNKDNLNAKFISRQLNRVKFIAAENDIDKEMLKGWKNDVLDILNAERAEIEEELFRSFSILLSTNNKGRVYFLLRDYSRAVRRVIRGIMRQYPDDDYEIMVEMSGEETGEDFGSRLTYHTLIYETSYDDCGDSEWAESDCYRSKVWRGSLESLCSRLSHDDKVVMVMGCEEIINDSTVCSSSSSSLLERFSEKSANVETIVVAGAFKYETEQLEAAVSRINYDGIEEILSSINKFKSSNLYTRVHLNTWNADRICGSIRVITSSELKNSCA